MDLAEYREDAFHKLQDDFVTLAAQLGIASVQCVPISALEGDNVVHRYNRMPWYHGPTLLEHLETVPLPEKDFRSEEHTSELQSQSNLVCRLLLEKKKK